MTEPREIAIKMIKETLENKVFFSEVKTQNQTLSSQDSGFINMLILTSFRHLIFIKKILKKFVKKKLPATAVYGKYALYLGATEILYLDTPDYAVINSYVEITKHLADKYVAGFVNAVLRNICKQKETLKKEDKGEFFPPEFFHILNQDYGKKTMQKIQAAAMLEPKLDITVKKDPQTWQQTLGGEVLPGGSLRLKNSGKITDLSGYKEGQWWVQDFSAALAVKTLTDIKEKRVLDMCAAPGGKTAQLLNMGAKVTALDISEKRLETLKENLKRLNFSADIICADAKDYIQNFQGIPFDVVLLDAPCSATGTIRRHPELVYIKRLKDVEKQAELQKEILSNINKIIAKNGILVYCTCSISKLEGEAQIANFLQNNPTFKVVPITSEELCGDDRLQEIITKEGYIRTLPQHLNAFGGIDAFFVAKLRKEN